MVPGIMVPTHDTVLYVQDSGAGQPLLFVHGTCGDANTWNEVVQTLDHEFHCIAYDRRGHTRSPRGRVSHPSIATHAADLADLIAALDLAPVLLVASDHGSDIVLELAREHPDMVRAAVLCGPPPRSIGFAATARYWAACLALCCLQQRDATTILSPF
jgi:pimeloyl-ACP methyl ester carboxylesterase